MRPIAVVVLGVLMDHDFEMAPIEDEHSVQTLTPVSADEALSEGAGPRCPDWSANGPDVIGVEDPLRSVL